MKNIRLFTCSLICVFSCFFSARAQMIIETVAGNGSMGFGGDNGQSIAAQVNQQYGICVDTHDNLYIADYGNNRIRRIDAITGIITTVAGTSGSAGSSGDNGPATLAKLNQPSGVAVDAVGNIYIADATNNKIRFVDATTNIITTIAGIGGSGAFGGDGAAATAAQLNLPRSVAVDASGNIYIADASNNRVRKVDAGSGNISTIAGTSGSGGFTGDGTATAVKLNGPRGIAVDASGNVYFGDFSNNRIRVIDQISGVLTTIVGSTSTSYNGDGIPAISANINGPIGLTLDASGNIYICDANSRIRMVDGSSTIWTVAGGGSSGHAGDGGLATASTAKINGPAGVAVTSDGRIYISDRGSNYVRLVEPNHTPIFNGGSTQTLDICANSGATTINSLLTVNEDDLVQNLRWTLITPPTNGIASITTFTVTSNGGNVTPSGFSYTPNTNFRGHDSFSVQISDGLDSTTTTVYINVNSYPGVITGPSSACIGATVSLSNPVTTGSWASSDPSVASIDIATGVVTCIAPGTATISYSVSAFPCPVASVTQSLSVLSVPSAGNITGPSSVCVGSAITLSEDMSGGTWSAAAGGKATVTSSGMVNGATAGTETITYTVSTICGLSSTSVDVTINPLPSAGTITGAATVCLGATVTFTDAVSGGAWSSSNTNASVSGGVITGMATGSGVISYSVTNMCGVANAIHAITVNTVPSPGTITGPTVVCQGATITLSNAVPAGVWSVTTGNASVTAGVVTGMAGGTDLISYRVGNACGNSVATYPVTVSGLPNPGTISGLTNVCQGSSILMTDGIPGGVWATSNANATISAGGLATGVTGGSVTISYSVTNSCGTSSATQAITVISSVTPSINVSASPDTILCTVSSPVTFTATSVNGGSMPVYDWTVNGIPVVGYGGLYTYTPASGDVVACKVTSNATCPVPPTAITHVRMTIAPMLTPGITVSTVPGDTVCPGIMVTYFATPVHGGTTPSYLWTNKGVSVGVGSSYSVMPASGDIIRCRMTSSMGCLTSSMVLSDPVIMHVKPAEVNTATITPSSAAIFAGQTVTFSVAAPYGGSSPSYQWYLDASPVPGATDQIYITDSAVAGQNLSCVVISSDPCAAPQIVTSNVITIVFSTGVHELLSAGGCTLIPNPNTGRFTITGKVNATAVSYEVVNMLGQVVDKGPLVVQNGMLNQQIALSSELANGVYFLHINGNESQSAIRFSLSR